LLGSCRHRRLALGYSPQKACGVKETAGGKPISLPPSPGLPGLYGARRFRWRTTMRPLFRSFTRYTTLESLCTTTHGPVHWLVSFGDTNPVLGSGSRRPVSASLRLQLQPLEPVHEEPGDALLAHRSNSIQVRPPSPLLEVIQTPSLLVFMAKHQQGRGAASRLLDCCPVSPQDDRKMQVPILFALVYQNGELNR
ncbi:hypothetical protein XENOCAPTIV_009839, partial [Xenoophorus captivus]